MTLADLHDFFAHPVRSFLRQQLRVTTPYDVDETKDAIPITLDGLEKWDVGDRLVRDVLSGGDPQSAMLAEQLRGLLPPEDLGVGHAHRDRAAGAPARGGRGPPAHRARTHPRRRHRPR